MDIKTLREEKKKRHADLLQQIAKLDTDRSATLEKFAAKRNELVSEAIELQGSMKTLDELEKAYRPQAVECDG